MVPTNFTAIDQDGEKREIGTLPSAEAENIPQGFQLDAERVLLFTADDQLHAYLLTLDGMQPIELPADVSWGRMQPCTGRSLPATG